MLEKTKKNFVIDETNVSYFATKIAKWIRSYVEEVHANGVVLGMSGGIDCSVVARLCQVAGVKTELVLMPYGDDMEKTNSYKHSMEFINKFGFSYHTYDIKPCTDALTSCVQSPLFDPTMVNLELAKANVRPRVRMSHLYLYAQPHNLLVIGTGNLSERTIGYFTKWGDGGCDFNPLGMITKREVYILARYLQIPDSIINKKPSAGLWEGQTDEDEIGLTYEQIDSYLLNGTSGEQEVDTIIEKKAFIAQHKLKAIPMFTMAA
ncbi:MAG: NAD(+) synthase [Clostridia bacterium]|jgi:NAD+ synthase|nr:NAD(+) synthase [Clostridia bacterium]